jgi:HAE1 family hydrophobic/amphiphilic exporter-1
MWHLTKFAVHNRIITLMVALILAGGSIWALLGLKIELFPDISLPFTTVATIYPEATPDTVVTAVSAPIEKAIWDQWSSHGLKHVTSTSSKGISVVMAEFEYGTDMAAVNNGINDSMSKLSFPQAVADFAKMPGGPGKNPQVIAINMSMIPLFEISLSGDLPPDQLKQIADSQVVPQLNGIDGVLRIDTEGGQADQVVVSPDPTQMNKYGISVGQIAASLPASSSSIADLAGSSIGSGGLKLADVAKISEGPPPLSTITRTNGKTSVGILISKTEKANTVEVARAVSDRVKTIQANLSPGVELTTIFDQSQFITSNINQLWEKAIIGGLLAIAVVFLFLWAIRASLITAISIPLSVLVGFLGMRLAGITINLLTLSAMSIAIGRLIDDSIVMVEVIFRRRKRGESVIDAAIGGAKEVANPITTATLATIAIFIPLMFVGGIVGEMFVPFALTVIFAMAASLLVALLVVPALSRFLISAKSEIKKISDNWYQRIYVRALKWTLLHRAFVVVIAIVLFLGSLGLIPVVGTSFMSGMGDKSLTVNIQLPANSDISATGNVAAQVEAFLNGNKAVKNVYSSIGTGTSMSGLMSAASGGGANTATITAYLNADADLKKVSADLKQACQKITGADAIDVADSESGGDPMTGSAGVNISVQGNNQADVAKTTGELMSKLNSVDGISNLAADLTTVVPRLNIAFDQSKAVASGVPPLELVQEYSYLTVGGVVQDKTVNAGGTRAVYMNSLASQLSSVEQAQQMKVGYPNSVSLGDIANISIQEMPSHIGHTDTALSATVTASITAKNVGAVNSAVQKQINTLTPHPGVDVKIAGIAEQMGESFSRMGIAILLAIIIVFIIVILMMRSVRNPLMIMISLPLAVIGALVGLAISRYTLSISAMMGLLMLVGIVLTNAIVLVALIEQLRKNGMTTHDALVEGGKTRLRPILMTAMTTIFAMVPMAVGLGSGSMLTAELAVVVIGGLFSSTLLTLFVIPVIYSLVHKQRLPEVGKSA